MMGNHKSRLDLQLSMISPGLRNYAKEKMSKIIFLLFLIPLYSCSIIKIHTKDSVETYRKFGFINFVETAPGSYVELSFAGIGISDHDFVLGYKHSNIVLMSDNECTVFIDKKSKIDLSIIEYLTSMNCNFIYLDKENCDE